MPARRLLTALAAPVALVLAAAGCTASASSGDSGAPIRIGFIADMSGIQKGNGISMRNGLDLYLRLHGNRMGGRRVQIVQKDEKDNPKTAAKAQQSLLAEKDLLAVTGVSDVRTVVALQPKLTATKRPLVISLACTDKIPNFTYIWCASNLTSDNATALGAYVAAHTSGKAYAIGTDLGPAKADTAQTFADTFTAAGGELANAGGKPAYVPYSDKTSYKSYLRDAEDRGATAIYVWATGLQAVNFIKEYRQLGLARKGITVYAGGPVTCCDLLKVEGPAALGIYSSLDYTPTLDNDANREFVVAYEQDYGIAPNEPAEYGYSAASVLDQAISSVSSKGRPLTGEEVNKAIADLGVIDDPRGRWQFGVKHAPVQKFYLRQVRWDGSVLSNVLVDELPTVGG